MGKSIPICQTGVKPTWGKDFPKVPELFSGTVVTFFQFCLLCCLCLDEQGIGANTVFQVSNAHKVNTRWVLTNIVITCIVAICNNVTRVSLDE